MKRIFLYLFFIVTFTYDAIANPAVAIVNQQRRERERRNGNRPVAGFILFENREKLDEIIQKNIIPNFETIYIHNLENKLNNIRNVKNLKIYYIEVIPFYDECKAFIIYEKKKEEKIEVKKLNWWE